MYLYYVCVSVKGQPTTSVEIRGTEKAWEAWRFASLGLAPMATVDLVDGLTGEVIQSSHEDWGE